MSGATAANRRSIERAGFCVLLSIMSMSFVYADDDAATTKFRQVYIPKRDESVLIPPDFEPIARRRLQAALQREEDRGTSQPTIDRTVLTARYSDGKLVSVGPSFFAVSHSDEAPGEMPLSPFNLAVRANGSLGASGVASLSTDGEGTAVLSVDDNENVEFSWSKYADAVVDSTATFNLKLPSAGNTEVYLFVAQGTILASKNVSIREISQHPLLDDKSTLGLSERLFLIEAGGQEQVQFDVVELNTAKRDVSLVVREASGVYQLGSESTDWRFEFDLNLPLTQSSVELTIPYQAVLSSVKVNGANAKFKIRTDDRLTILAVELKGLRELLSSSNLSIAIEGLSMPLESGWNELPFVDIRRPAIMSGARPTLRIEYQHPIDVVDFDSDMGWMRLNSSENSSLRAFRLSSSSWSVPPRIFVDEEASVENAENLLQLEIGKTDLNATWDCLINYDVDDNTSISEHSATAGPDVVSIELEPNWNDLKATVVSSGREIEILADSEKVLVWPDAEEIGSHPFHLRITGSRPLAKQSPVRIAPFFFVRLAGSEGSVTTAVTTSSRVWFRNIEQLHPFRLDAIDIPKNVAGLLADGTENTRFFALPAGEIPPIEFDRPASRVDARIDVQASMRGERVRETIDISIENVNGSLADLTIRFPQTKNQPIRWSALRNDQTSLPVTFTVQGPAEREDGSQVWKLKFVDNLEEGTSIRGVRFLSGPTVTLDLPSVGVPQAFQAFNQKGTVRLDQTLSIKEISDNIQRIPDPKLGSESSVRAVVRYNPTVESNLVVQQEVDSFYNPVVESLHIVTLADSSGMDTVWIGLIPSNPGTISIDIEPNMVFQSASQSSVTLTSERISLSKGQFSCEASSDAPLLLTFTRETPTRTWGRIWQAPRVTCGNPTLAYSGTIVANPGTKSLFNEYLFPATTIDEQLRTSLVDAHPYLVDAEAFRCDSTDKVLLVNAGAFTGLCCGFGLVVAAVGWLIGRTRVMVPLGVVSLVLLCIGLWGNWDFSLLMLPMIPFAAGNLCALSKVRGSFIERVKERNASNDDSRSFLLLRLLAFLVFSTFASIQVFSDDNRQIYSLLIPIDSKGNVNDNVYVHPDLYREVKNRQRDYENNLALRFQAAIYRLNLVSDAFQSSGKLIRGEIIWSIANPYGAKELTIPIQDRTLWNSIQRIEDITSSETFPILKPDYEAALGIRIELNGRPRVSIRCLFAMPVAIDGATGIESVSIGIPPVLNASLELKCDTGITNVSCDVGNRVFSPKNQASNFAVELGPADELRIQWRSQDADSSIPIVNIQRRWYVHVTEDQLSKEVQLEFSQPDGKAIEAIELVVDTQSVPLVTSGSWSIQSVAPFDEGCLLLRLASSNTRTGRTLGLLWKDELLTGFRSSDVELPAISQPSNPSESIEYAVGISCPTGFEIFALDDSKLTKAETTEFVWNSKTSPITNVFLSQSQETVTFEVVPQDRIQPFGDELHSIKVTPRALEIDYELSIFDLGNLSDSFRFRIPKGMVISDVIVDGEPSQVGRVPSGEFDILVVSPVSNVVRATDIQIRSSVNLSADGTFGVPRIYPTEITLESSEYKWSRVAEVEVIEVAPAELENQSYEVERKRQLTTRTFPLWRWELDVQWLTEPLISGRYELRDASLRTRSSTITSINRSEKSWSAHVHLDVSATRGRADVISFEVPTNWFQGLTPESVRGDLLAWISQPSINPGSVVVHVLPEKQPTNRYKFVLTGAAREDASELVSVPNIRMLSLGNNKQFFAVPRSLKWEVASANEVSISKSLSEFAKISETHVTYQANGSFSATLVAGSRAALTPFIPICVVEQFASDFAKHLRVRWDVFPSTIRDLRVRIPENMKLVDAQVEKVKAELNEQDGMVRVGLRYSDLPQQVELLLELSSDTNGHEIKLPQVEGVEVGETWIMDRDGGIESAGLPFARSETVGLLRTQLGSIDRCLDAALDSVQERTQFELENWISPWIGRRMSAFQQLESLIPVTDADSDLLREPLDRILRQIGFSELPVDAVYDRKNQSKVSIDEYLVFKGQPTSLTLADESPLVSELSFDFSKPLLFALCLLCLSFIVKFRNRSDAQVVGCITWLAILNACVWQVGPKPVAVLLVTISLTVLCIAIMRVIIHRLRYGY